MGEVGNQGKDLGKGYVGFALNRFVSRVLLLFNSIPTNGFQFKALSKYFIFTM